MRQFWKFTLASLTGTFLFVVLFSVFTAIGAVGLVGILAANMAKGSTPLVEKDSVMVYDLSTIISDSEVVPSPTDILFVGQRPGQLTLREAVVALRAAAEDDRITGLYLKGGSELGIGLASQTELRKAIEVFRDSGKPVIAYDVSWTEREYLMASAAQSVYMNPFGNLEMNGLYAEMMYQAEALSKLGVGVQVTRVGKYKSAVEPLLRNDMSPEERDQTQRLLRELWQSILESSAQPRPVTAQALQNIANNQGFLFGEEAKTQQLVDQIVYEDEVIAELRSHTNQSEDDLDDEEDFRQVSLQHYADMAEDTLTSRSSSNQIAVVYAEGQIVDGDGSSGFGGSQVIAGNQMAQQLRELRLDEEVKAVVLRVNSPGGSAIASEIILREVRLLQESGKPVIVSMGDVAASGGYWIASLADRIVAEPTTITGSIGVFSLFVNLEDLGGKVGVSWDGVKTSDLADIFTSTRPKTAKELTILQKSVDQIYDEFLARVVEGRELPAAKVAEIAQGRVWSGQAAKDLGLVDELGGLERAIEVAAEMSDLGEDWRLQEYPEGDEWNRFFASFFESARAERPDPLTAQLEKLKQDVKIIQQLNDPRGIYALLPYQIKFD
ncbi:signal peptide peptidase SppA [Pseudanabaena sp. FACHB-2040]|uniref:signal peptide peptidase SppA n=1 Tax=Pseudanabaena sp. FACHB-2040 TaxID=2692859 RepID=UPI001681EFAF|nr:signal peptide peptidase SppA [Pseudanabaena sp. FACHB-2040]MBD2259236.1 signal peptide peptidase SppA [Pseudanabaena sp. FACHB-2040]